MVRGRKPIKALEDAENAARSFGYRWLANQDPDLPYDAVLFSSRAAIAVKVRSVRSNPDSDQFIDDLFKDDLDGLRKLPVPPHFIREFWLRTRNTRGWRIFVVVEGGIGEIEFSASIGYYNPYYAKALKKRLPDLKTRKRDPLK
ncbi:MAG: hypothetical protein ABFC24_07025 [Methanoregulaceae archaeon]